MNIVCVRKLTEVDGSNLLEIIQVVLCLLPVYYYSSGIVPFPGRGGVYGQAGGEYLKCTNSPIIAIIIKRRRNTVTQ